MTPAATPVLGMVLKGYPRISETFISNEILLLEQMGFRLHLFSMRRPRENFTHRSVQKIRARVDYLPETLLTPLPKFLYHNARLAARQPGAYADAFRTAWRRFRRTRKNATIKHLLQAGYLVDKLLPQQNIAHLHAHFAHSPASVAMFSSRLSGRPFSFTAHAKDIYTSDPQQLSEKLALARFVVTCTEYNRQHLKALAPGLATPIHRVYHGIDTDLFNGGRHRDRPVAPFNILTIARITAKKGLPTVYRALKHLVGQGVAVKHILIGDGLERKALLALIDELDLGGRCIWLGTRPHEVVLEHFREADLFVLGCEIAADGDRDGIPNVLLESMAMGVPVVATRVSATPELVIHEKTGLMVPPGDPSRLAAAMHRMLTDTDLRRQVIPAARKRVREHFDNKILIRDLAAIYAGEAGIRGS